MYPVPSNVEEAAFPYGAWERPVSGKDTMLAYVVEPAHIAGPVVHWAPHVPDSSLFYPVPVRMLTRDMPVLAAGGKLTEFIYKSGYWSATAMSDYMDDKWTLVIDQVKAMQVEIENESHAFLLDLQLTPDRGDVQARVEAFHDHMLERFWSLHWQLLAEFQSGYTNFGNDRLGYSKWVLDQSHYGDWATRYPGDPELPARFDGMRSNFVAVQAVMDARFSQGADRHESAVLAVPTVVNRQYESNSLFAVVAVASLLALVIGLAGGLMLGRRSSMQKQQPLLS